MTFDVIVVGAGIGGLSAAARLARAGRSVLVLEKLPHIGGTSYVFRRGGYFFPMGPLSFSHPARVESFLRDLDIEAGLEFKRNHFQLLTPAIDVVYSRPFANLRSDLQNAFPAERQGLDRFFTELEGWVRDIRDIDRWHPDFRLPSEPSNFSAAEEDVRGRPERIRSWSAISVRDLLDEAIADPNLKSLLGSQGTGLPVMSALNLAFMWRAMSDVGIWFPSNGLHGLCRMLASAVAFHGGKIVTSAPAGRILVAGGRAVGVRTVAGETFSGRWIVSNADYKRTFLELIDPAAVPRSHLDLVRNVPYTGSELCVYLGLDPTRVDFRRMRAEHLFYRKELRPQADSPPEDFDNREIEICRWSENAPDSVPRDRASLILRVDFPHKEIAAWRTGEKARRAGYREMKNRLAWKLIRTVESALPGLSSAVEVLETATPLTYQDWGQRTEGSIAGWTWSADAAGGLPGQFLVETPIGNLLTAGIYAAKELFLGGVPTAMHTGAYAADLILR